MNKKIIPIILAGMIAAFPLSSTPVMAGNVSQETAINTENNDDSSADSNNIRIGLVNYRYMPDQDAYEVFHISSAPWDIEDGTYIELESEINGKPVISIATHTIVYSLGDLEDGSPFLIIKLSENIERIENAAFLEANVKVLLNNKLRYIGDSAFFYSFVGITDFTLPGSIRTIGKRAFACSPIEILRLEDGIKEIGDKAFGDCNLKKVYVPNSVTKIGKDAFYARDVDEDCWEFPNVKPTIYCEANSTAHRYALQNKYPYKLYDMTNEIPATTLTRQATHYNGATLKWKSLSNVDGYRIYRSATGKDGSWTALKNVSGKSTTTYRDTTAKIGKTYYYTVKGYKKAGKYKKYGNFKSNTVKATPYLKTPTVTKVSSRTAQFQWNKVSGATGYQLWRANNPDGLYKRIQVSKTTSAKDTTAKKGKTYYYKIRAYRKVSNKYVYSKCTDVRKLTIK